jgi:hypothetical protein
MTEAPARPAIRAWYPAVLNGGRVPGAGDYAIRPAYRRVKPSLVFAVMITS